VFHADLKLELLLPQPPECWDYKQMLPCPATTSWFERNHVLITSFIACSRNSPALLMVIVASLLLCKLKVKLSGRCVLTGEYVYTYRV
jgi:hypothetical protein